MRERVRQQDEFLLEDWMICNHFTRSALSERVFRAGRPDSFLFHKRHPSIRLHAPEAGAATTTHLGLDLNSTERVLGDDEWPAN